ncbi:MAG: FkbM family methyltransferase [Rhodospirillaceae bacterium]
MSKSYSRFLASLVTGLTGFQRAERAERNRLLVRQLLAARHRIETPRGPITLVCTDRREVHYAHHFFDREPSLLKWIDGFETPCTYWDVGANTGIYALYAALDPAVKVHAFEPLAATYAALCTNIQENAADPRIDALCLGFFDRTVIGELRTDNAEAGSAHHDFGAGGAAAEGGPKFRQSALTFSIDDFRRLYEVAAPNYLKIDVDGVEEEILRGAAETLRDPAVRSVLVEIVGEDARGQRMVNLLAGHGFAIDDAQSDAYNVVFTR